MGRNSRFQWWGGSFQPLPPWWHQSWGSLPSCPPCPATAPTPHTWAKCSSSVCVTFINACKNGCSGWSWGETQGLFTRGAEARTGLLSMPPCLWRHSLVPAVIQAAAGKLKVPFPKGLETTLLFKRIGTGKEKLGFSPYLEMPAGCKYLKVALLHQNGF